jgi:hypothetical protein
MAYPSGKKSYAELTDGERWTWHTGVYAFRHVTLGRPIAPGSPPDPEGKYFDKNRVEYEVRRLRDEAQPPPPLFDPHGEVLRREGVAICNEFARARGWPDFNTAFEAGAISYTDVIRSIGGPQRMPGEPATEYDLTNLQKDLGLSAKEFNPSAAAMARARRELGLDEPSAPEQGAKHG